MASGLLHCCMEYTPHLTPDTYTVVASVIMLFLALASKVTRPRITGYSIS